MKFKHRVRSGNRPGCRLQHERSLGDADTRRLDRVTRRGRDSSTDDTDFHGGGLKYPRRGFDIRSRIR
jgi:hypothetical protein